MYQHKYAAASQKQYFHLNGLHSLNTKLLKIKQNDKQISSFQTIYKKKNLCLEYEQLRNKTR